MKIHLFIRGEEKTLALIIFPNRSRSDRKKGNDSKDGYTESSVYVWVQIPFASTSQLSRNETRIRHDSGSRAFEIT